MEQVCVSEWSVYTRMREKERKGIRSAGRPDYEASLQEITALWTLTKLNVYTILHWNLLNYYYYYFFFRDRERFILRTRRVKILGTLIDCCIVWGARLHKAQISTNIVHLCYIATGKHRAELPFISGGNSIHLAVLEKDKWTTMWNGALRSNLLPSCPEWTSWLTLPCLKALKCNSALCKRSPQAKSDYSMFTLFHYTIASKLPFYRNPEPLGILQFARSLKI